MRSDNLYFVTDTVMSQRAGVPSPLIPGGTIPAIIAISTLRADARLVACRGFITITYNIILIQKYNPIIQQTKPPRCPVVGQAARVVPPIVMLGTVPAVRAVRAVVTPLRPSISSGIDTKLSTSTVSNRRVNL